MQQIAFFDFDGTITTRDTLLEFIKFSKGRFKFYMGFLLNCPWLVAMKFKVISNQTAKQRIFRWFFRNQPLQEFQEQCSRFAATVIPGLLRPKALKEIQLLQEKGVTVVIVSASPESWILPWARPLSITCIGTRLETANNALTGRIYLRNCHGKEKCARIRENYQLEDYTDIYAYGDTSGDKPMLALATKSFYKPFR
ncbi:MAG TPA: HAD-IB family hydrolase [Puia sp.]|nr:HAD-IB family hydrolase [Puia sp.]